MSEQTTVVEEFFRGALAAMYQFETEQEARDFVTRQGEEPGVEWVIHAD